MQSISKEFQFRVRFDQYTADETGTRDRLDRIRFKHRGIRAPSPAGMHDFLIGGFAAPTETTHDDDRTNVGTNLFPFNFHRKEEEFGGLGVQLKAEFFRAAIHRPVFQTIDAVLERLNLQIFLTESPGRTGHDRNDSKEENGENRMLTWSIFHVEHLFHDRTDPF